MIFNFSKNWGRALSLVLCLATLLSLFTFSSCSKNKEVALTLNDTPISDDVAIYFIDQATTELGFDARKSVLEEKTIELASGYFKTNSLAHAHGITLSLDEKVGVSEKVDATWSIFGGYYSKIGVTRETLTKIFTADAYRDKLILAYYDKGGPEEISQNRLYANFKTNYVVFQAITGYFTTSDLEGNSVQLPQSEIETLILKFQNMKNMVNAGEQDMEGAADYLSESGIQCSVQTVVLHKDDTSYPAGFFKKVQTADKKRSTVIASNEYIFLVLPGEANAKSTFFKEKKVEIIKNIVGSGIDKTINNAYEVDGDIDSSSFNSYFALIKGVKKK